MRLDNHQPSDRKGNPVNRVAHSGELCYDTEDKPVLRQKMCTMSGWKGRNTMRYKQFGKTGMQVSEMALGTWGIGGVGWDTHSEESRLDAIRAAVEAGVTFFDTAPAYNAGVAEQVLGKALADLGARKNVIISTKCGNEYINGGYVKDGDPKKILRECEESLRNLRTDYIEIGRAHV